MKRKRGISPVIGTILLVALVVGGSVGIFMLIKNYPNIVGKDALKEKLCSETSFLIADFCYKESTSYNIETRENEQKTYIQFNGQNNVDNSVLVGFLLSIDYGGNIISISTLPNEIEGGSVKNFATDFIENPLGITQIEISPKIEVDNEIAICDKNSQNVKWEEIEAC